MAAHHRLQPMLLVVVLNAFTKGHDMHSDTKPIQPAESINIVSLCSWFQLVDPHETELLYDATEWEANILGDYVKQPEKYPENHAIKVGIISDFVGTFKRAFLNDTPVRVVAPSIRTVMWVCSVMLKDESIRAILRAAGRELAEKLLTFKCYGVPVMSYKEAMGYLKAAKAIDMENSHV